MSSEYIIILLIILISTILRATFGFGDALIAMPLLTLVIGVKTAAPLSAFISLAVAIWIVLQERKSPKITGFKRILISTIIGIPIGLTFLKGTNETLVKGVLAIILIAFSLFKLFNPQLFELKTDKYSPIFGLFSGILGGAYNSNGPPIIIYGTLRRWESERFRTILQGIFLPTNLFIIAGQGIAGLWTEQVGILFLLSLPLVILSIYVGNILNARIPQEKFVKYVYILLLIIGLVLLFNACLN